MIYNNSIMTDNFAEVYPVINKYVTENGDFLNSRYGPTREIIDFKTTLSNPLVRCVGGNKRDINIFFLIAEAIWIWRGQKDVEFLTLFNKKMSEFSDDGEVFHAPYGFRLRHHGVSSYDKIPMNFVNEKNQHAIEQQLKGLDQIEENLILLSENPNTRRAVMQIWNSNLDLNVDSKDLPCNDLVMLKIRDGKLRTTIANRSNDLHWGLTTNIFQFSFVSELMARILGIEVGTQTHNSQSLHVYMDNPISTKQYDLFQLGDKKFDHLYRFAIPFRMDINFKTEEVTKRLVEIDHHLDIIMNSIKKGRLLNDADKESLYDFCPVFLLFYELLVIYRLYKEDWKTGDNGKRIALKELIKLNKKYPSYDIICLAQNFFNAKMKDRVTSTPLINKLISPIIL